MSVLVTGGAGFIGSHCCVDLATHGVDVVVVDDHSNSSPRALDRVAELVGVEIPSYEIDVRDPAELESVFAAHDIDAVIHFAARKAVGESVAMPIEYYESNVGGLLNLLRTMRAHEVDRLVFSSSCSIYGDADDVPILEDTPPRPTNPYARTKWMGEQILADACAVETAWSVMALRYFNPVGAHESGRIGEDPRGIPNNLMPYLTQLAVGRLHELSVFGDDYPTVDGTGVRDYIHVMDVVEGHRVALEHMTSPGFRSLNLGTGTGTSVLQLLAAFTEVCGRELPYRIVARRPGDVAELVADPERAAVELGWRARRDVLDMCRDAWRFQQENPGGYEPA
ncbi:MAG: galE [Actinomycetia bacterium]|nr:galE [Actinomycetes bacterium]